ncbi:MAG: hypothetical protein FRX49_04732 [Trebouxia sp. A1-2]|nr:MAG: hypothetical protein FRX49_04732 [Trebouxia sp. A1-2]
MVYQQGATETWKCLAVASATEVELHTNSPTVQIYTGPPLLPDQLLAPTEMMLSSAFVLPSLSMAESSSTSLSLSEPRGGFSIPKGVSRALPESGTCVSASLSAGGEAGGEGTPASPGDEYELGRACLGDRRAMQTSRA